jgi:hypothetical protein
MQSASNQPTAARRFRQAGLSFDSGRRSRSAQEHLTAVSLRVIRSHNVENECTEVPGAAVRKAVTRVAHQGGRAASARWRSAGRMYAIIVLPMCSEPGLYPTAAGKRAQAYGVHA